MKRLPDAAGRFGRFGGRFVPETLMAPLLERERAYARARRDRRFLTRLRALLRDYAGRPTPLFFAARLTERVTGERAVLPPDLQSQIRALRRATTKPVCVGFGIGRPELADGVIVGSAIVRLIEERAGSASLVPDVGDFVASLKEPLRPPAAASAGATRPEGRLRRRA